MLRRFEKSLQWERLFIVPFDLHITLIWLFQGSKLKTRSMQTKFQTNIMRHCCMQRVAHVWPPCINMLQDVGWCWVSSENGQIFVATFLDVARVWPASLQYLTTQFNNVGSYCVEMLRAFYRASRSP